MQQEQKIKGFTILELLVVITIVSIVSAIGYPRFNDWKTDREVRQALERAASMVNSIITHTQKRKLSICTNRYKKLTDSNYFYYEGYE